MGATPGGGRDGADGVPPVLAPLTALRLYAVLAVTFSNLGITGTAHRVDIQLVGDTGISRRIP